MTHIVEQDIEDAALDILQNDLGYSYLYGPDIAPDGKNALRERWDQVILLAKLRQAIDRLNPSLSAEAVDEAVKKIKRLSGKQIIENNEIFHAWLTEGMPLDQRSKGRIVHETVKLIDISSPINNDFTAVNQFTVIEENRNRRPDIIIFINGLPIAVIELKNPGDEKATIESAYNQIQTYKQEIPSIFNYNELLVISDGTFAQVGSLTSTREWFLPWKAYADGKIAPKAIPQLQVLLEGLFKKEVLVDVIRNYIAFSESKKRVDKILAGYHQYHAANRAIDTTRNAIKTTRKAGVVWHTQGSGKSYTLAFYAGKLQIQDELNNPTLVILTDRNDLDDQLFNTFSTMGCLREKPIQATSKDNLKEKLNRASGGIIFTTIQKFGTDAGKVDLISERSNIIVAADEAHRTQYGFEARVKIKENEVETKYGFAKYLRDALPNATFIGFTGTPIDFKDKSTRAVFGDYIHVYDIEQAVEDKRTVRIYYESRLAQLNLKTEERLSLDRNFEEVTEGEENERKEKLKSEWARVEAIVGSESRVKQIAKDIVKHFEAREEVLNGKAMIVCMSRRICVELYNELSKLRPKWIHKDDDKGLMKIIMTGSASDGPEWQQHIRDKKRRKELGEIFKDPESEFKLAIVRDMWLTGFDVPSLNTLYLDKPMQGHGLMQAIARVNRVFQSKEGGLIVDYLGIAQELKTALTNYTESGGKGKPTFKQSDAIAIMQEKYEVVSQMYHGFNYKRFFTGTPKERMHLIPAAMEHILAQNEGKKRYIKEVAGLVQAFALSVPSKESEVLRDEIGFFQAVKASIVKNTEIEPSQKPDTEIHLALKQIVSKAVSSDGVIDIFEAAGMKKPDISILSDSFLKEMQGMEHKNLAIEALNKLLNDQIKARFKTNMLKSRRFSEMLDEAIRRYQNRSIDSAHVIQELINIARQIKEDKSRGKELGLSLDEEAFYDALADNESARRILGDQILKQLSVELTKTVRENTSIDWTLRESVQAHLKILVKRLLRKYGYPPDQEKRATDLVIEQAKRLAEEWAMSQPSVYDNYKDNSEV